MSLRPGSQLGAYDIVALIGQGGMGEVYRAHDTRLKRDVAIKILPEAFSNDPDRLARFQREAEVIASLNHSNIAAIHGLEESSGTRALVLELVEGETLADRISRSAIPIDEALPIARQIAEALEAAHERGIVHRDLKPANIKITLDGTAKVLDFGLAKLADLPTSGSGTGTAELSHSPTITSPALVTGGGVLLGTAAYMSPEQARGKPADRRSDIWAFGCVLYEMLTGRRAFDGEEVADTLAAVLTKDPEWAALPPATPALIQRLVRRCLQKDRARRLDSAAAVRLDIQDASLPNDGVHVSTEISSVRTRKREWIAWTVAALGILASTVLAFIVNSRARVESPLVRFLVNAPEGQTFGQTPGFSAVSPDGHRMIFVATGADHPNQLWVQTFDGQPAQPIPGTERAEFPFWAPNGRSVGYFADGKLLKVDLPGGRPQVICDAAFPEGGTWGDDGTILFASNQALLRVQQTGGAPALVLRSDFPGDGTKTTPRFPSFLPGGRRYIFFGGQSGQPGGIYLGTIGSQGVSRLVAADSRAMYSNRGYLTFARQGTLFAQPFDANRGEVQANPVVVAERIQSSRFNASFSLSSTDVLIYRAGSAEAQNQLVWFDRTGRVLGTAGPPGAYNHVDLSPDGRTIATHPHEGADGGGVWLVDARGGRTRLTTSGHNAVPHWSHDGAHLVFSSNRDRDGMNRMFVMDTSGLKQEPLFPGSKYGTGPSQWSADGRYIVFQYDSPKTLQDLWVLPMFGDRKPFSFLTTEFSEAEGVLSPDGQWMAYTSSESSQLEVYLRSFPSAANKRIVSTSGGRKPQWRGDGRELFFLDTEQNMVSVDIRETAGTLEVSPAKLLFKSNAYDTTSVGGGGAFVSQNYAVSRDGQRFLVIVPSDHERPEPINVVLNWPALLKK